MVHNSFLAISINTSWEKYKRHLCMTIQPFMLYILPKTWTTLPFNSIQFKRLFNSEDKNTYLILQVEILTIY